MNPTQTALLTRDLVHAIATRPNEPPEDRLVRAETAIAQIEALAPADPTETLFAGQIVLFQTLILDAVNDAHTADSPADAHKHRQQAIALGRIQTSYLSELRRHRAKRAAEAAQLQSSQAQPAPSPEPAQAKEVPAAQNPLRTGHPFDPPGQSPARPQTSAAPQKPAGTTGQRAHPTRHAASAMRWT